MAPKSNDEPLTPMGRLCLHPEHNHIVHCAIGHENPINIESLKDEIMKLMISKIPRFSCLLVLDSTDGSEHWRKTQVNLDDHIFFHDHDDDQNETAISEEDMVNSYLADLAVSSPLSMDKPLWEIHILPGRKCMIVRVHHAIADGMSLMSMLWTMGRSRSMHDGQNHVNNRQRSDQRSLKKRGLWEFLVFIWYSLVYGLKFLVRCLWVRDKGHISGIEGVEFWPRKVATARFTLSDMKAIKTAIPNATVHDVLYGVVWCGLTRYLRAQNPDQAVPDGAQITGMCPFNLRKPAGLQDLSHLLGDGSKNNLFGNKFSIILLPMHYSKERELHPLTYVARAKANLDRKKQSAEAQISYEVVSLTSRLVGNKAAGFFYYKLFCNTSFLLSNMAGPQEKISIAGNPVTFIRASSSSQPQAITMHLVSYAGKADLQIQVAKEVIPDPKFLAKCFENALLDMKEAAENVGKNSEVGK